MATSTTQQYANSTDIIQLDLSRFQRLLSVLMMGKAKRNKSIMIRGMHGVGKSSVVLQEAQAQAQQMEREFVKLEEVDLQSILHLFEGLTREEAQAQGIPVNPTKVWLDPAAHYVYYDLRISQRDFVDFVGAIDKIGDGQNRITRFTPVDWVVVFSHQDIAGCLFFDEIDRGTTMVRNAVFEIVHDRRVNTNKISDQVFIAAAGNSGIGMDHLYDSKAMDAALTDRFWNLHLSPTLDEWLTWARDPEMAGTSGHKIVASFIEKHPTMLDYPMEARHDIDAILPSRRSWGDFGFDLTTYLSSLKDGEKMDARFIEDLLGGYVGKTAADVFKEWMKNTIMVTWGDVKAGKYEAGTYLEPVTVLNIIKEALSDVDSLVTQKKDKAGETYWAANKTAERLASFVEDIYEDNREIAALIFDTMTNSFSGGDFAKIRPLMERAGTAFSKITEDGPLHHIMTCVQPGTYMRDNPYKPRFSAYAKKRRTENEDREAARQALLEAEAAEAASESEPEVTTKAKAPAKRTKAAKK